MNLILFDDISRIKFLPFTFTRPVAYIRIGIFTISEKWEKRIRVFDTSYLTVPYLREKFSLKCSDDNLFINSKILPDDKVVGAITTLNLEESLFNKGELVAFRSKKNIEDIVEISQINEIEYLKINVNDLKRNEYIYDVKKIENLWDIFHLNASEIVADFKLISAEKKSMELPDNVIATGNNIFIESGAKISFSIINSNTGPVYIGKDSEIMEGAMIRGPFALCNNSIIKMGAKIYGASSIGPYCKVGGEINNSVFFSYSNKAHDGFLGNSVIGEWCNIGADTNNSNLKNNYANVKLWNYEKKEFVDTGLQFCGLFMGDHSKCGINTMFNTGTVCGVSTNIFGTGFPRKFIPSFSWGGTNGFKEFKLEKSFEVAEKIMKRRNILFSDIDKKIFEEVFNVTKKFRI